MLSTVLGRPEVCPEPALLPRAEAVTDAISRAREEVPRGDLSCRQSAASPGFWGRRLEVLCRSITSVHLNLELRLSRTGGHGAVQQVMEKPAISPASSSPAPGATVVTVGEACICGNREGPAERVRAPRGLLAGSSRTREGLYKERGQCAWPELCPARVNPGVN